MRFVLHGVTGLSIAGFFFVACGGGDEGGVAGTGGSGAVASGGASSGGSGTGGASGATSGGASGSSGSSSGGAGNSRGGDGVIRCIEFLAPLEVSILSQRRGPYPPFGLSGGLPGALGRNTLVRVDGTVEELSARALVKVQPGDVLTIETPGGGGFGLASGSAD